MSDILTKEKFYKLKDGKIFKEGTIDNNPKGLYMTNSGGKLRYIAKKGYGDDWCIYVGWENQSSEEVARSGQKLNNEKNIQKVVPCDKEVFNKYRH